MKLILIPFNKVPTQIFFFITYYLRCIQLLKCNHINRNLAVCISSVPSTYITVVIYCNELRVNQL